MAPIIDKVVLLCREDNTSQAIFVSADTAKWIRDHLHEQGSHLIVEKIIPAKAATHFI